MKHLLSMSGTSLSLTEPKTMKSKRVITLPDFLVEELEEYVDRMYGMMAHDRLFSITKSYLEKEMIRGVKLSGVKKFVCMISATAMHRC